MLVILRMLGTGTSLRQMDDQDQMGVETIRYYFCRFIRYVKKLYGQGMLKRRPSPRKREAIREKYPKLGFPGCVGCVDCMNLVWKFFSYQLKGQYHSYEDWNFATIKVKAWCHHDLYVWN